MKRLRFVLPALAVLLPVLVLVGLVLATGSSTPREAPVVVASSDLVAQSVAEEVDPDRIATFPSATAEQARAAVEDGRAVAALAVDPTTEADVLYVASANGSDLNEAVVADVEDALATLGRTAAVQDVHLAAVPRVVPTALVAAGLLVGVGSVLVRRVRASRGAVQRHLVERIATDALLVGVALGLTAVFAGLPGSPPTWIVLGALVTAAAATVTAGLLRLLGLWGLGFAAAALLATTVPLVRATHPLLLPTAWAETLPWFPSGAAADVATQLALFEGVTGSRPWLVLAAWAVVGAAVVAVPARRRKPTGAIEA